jgi:hypothetical protein
LPSGIGTYPELKTCIESLTLSELAHANRQFSSLGCASASRHHGEMIYAVSASGDIDLK